MSGEDHNNHTSATSMLELSPEQMKRLGYDAIDVIVEHYAHLRRKPAIRTATRSELEARLRQSVPRRPGDPHAVLERAVEQVFGAMANVGHPRFFGYVPDPSNYVGVVADLLASGFNPFAGNWSVASGPAQLELVVLDWLREICGMPEGTDGVFVSGGSMANMMALVVAREQRFGAHDPRGVIYCSDQTHASVRKAARVLGFAGDRFQVVASDERGRIVIEELAGSIRRDRDAGLVPFFVVANAGTTNSGAVDDLEQVAAVCRGRELWLHVDGAYGAAAMISSEVAPLLSGVSHADSLSLDPHKWMFQPFECGCLLVRNPKALTGAFESTAEYMREAEGGADHVNFRNHGIQLTRGFRAFKLWMSLQTFGADAFARSVERGIELAEYAQGRIENSPDWDVVTPAQLAVVTFVRHNELPPDRADEFHQQLARRVAANGRAMLITTIINGRTVLRLCTINPRSDEADIDAVFEELRVAENEINQ